MTNLAIKGHTTRGKEIIELLEMMGGKNVNRLNGIFPDFYYTINDSDEIIRIFLPENPMDYECFILESFLEKYPYKVGDKVIIKKKNQIAKVDGIAWCFDTIVYWLRYDNRSTGNWRACLTGNWRAEELKPYEEENYEL